MPIDLQNIGEGAKKFLAQMLPYLVQQKFQKQMLDYQTKAWLEKSLKEYEAYGGIQEKLQRQAQLNALFGDVSDVLKPAVKDTPFPGAEFIKRAQSYGIPTGELKTPAPEVQEAAVQDYQATALPLIMSRLSGQKPSVEAVQKALGSFGYDAVYTMIGDYAGDVLKRAEQDLRSREIDIQAETVPIRRKEAETSAANLELEKKGGQTAKEIQAEIKSLSNERDTQVQKSTGLGSPMGFIWDSQSRVIAAKIAKIDTRLKEIEQITGRKILPGPEDYAMFKKMAQENVQSGLSINWEQALILGYDVYWLQKLQQDLGIVIKKEK